MSEEILTVAYDRLLTECGELRQENERLDHSLADQWLARAEKAEAERDALRTKLEVARDALCSVRCSSVEGTYAWNVASKALKEIGI
jgi:hypothetical protein